MIFDASCAIVNVHFSRNVSLLNEAIEKTEETIFCICDDNGITGYGTYKKRTEKKYLAFAKSRKRPNYMTVPAAIKELEKIEMVRLTDNKYRLDHAVTAAQKTILKAFGMDADMIKYYAAEISQILKEAK